MRGKRILFPFVGDSIGGSHISAVELICELRRRGHEAIAGIHQTDGPLMDYLSESGERFIELPDLALPRDAFRRPLSVAGVIRRSPELKRFLTKNRFEICHTNDRRMHLAWLMPCRFADVAHVWHQRSLFSSSTTAVPAILATKVVSISDFAMATMPRWIAKRAVLVTNPVDVTTTSAEVRVVRDRILQRTDVAEPVAVIAWAANFSARKRPSDFIEMADILLKANRDLIFVMLGEAREPQASEVRSQLRSKALGDRVLLMGTQRPIAPWLAAADLLVVTSSAEPFGRTLVEAMQLGTAVVAADDGGHKEIIEDRITGLLVPKEPAAMATAVRELLDDPEKRTRIENEAMRAVEGLYSIESHGSAVSAIYDSVKA